MTFLQHDEFRQTYKKKVLVVQMQLAEKQPTVPKTSFEMEKSKAPTFSGRIIDYPEFKRGWTKAAGVRWDEPNRTNKA